MSDPRVGFGYDVHRFSKNSDLILGGVKIPYEKGLEGHSDADVLLHSIMDAMLGAAALGDIGTHFPDNDPNYKDADSSTLLRKCQELLHEHGYHVGNIDATIVAREPKIAPYIDQMQEVISRELQLNKDVISIKATTSEGLGFVGRKEGISASAVILIKKSPR